MGEKSGVVGKVVHYYWIIESAKKWIMECVNEHSVFSKSDFGERRSTMQKKNYKGRCCKCQYKND